jgi:hypothetical protein
MTVTRHVTNDTKCTGSLINSLLKLCMWLYFFVLRVRTSRQVYTCSELKSKWQEVKATLCELARPYAPPHTWLYLALRAGIQREIRQVVVRQAECIRRSYSDPSTPAPPQEVTPPPPVTLRTAAAYGATVSTATAGRPEQKTTCLHYKYVHVSP